MKIQLIIAALLLIGSIDASAQEKKRRTEQDAPQIKATVQSETKINVNEIYKVVATKPEPKFNISEYLAKNIKYPQEALENRIQGKVVVQFVVERDGYLSAVTVIRGEELTWHSRGGDSCSACHA